MLGGEGIHQEGAAFLVNHNPRATTKQLRQPSPVLSAKRTRDEHFSSRPVTGLAAKADNETGAPRSALLRAYLTARRAHAPPLPAVPASPQRVCNAPPSVVVQLSGRHRAPLGRESPRERQRGYGGSETERGGTTEERRPRRKAAETRRGTHAPESATN